MVLFSLAGMTVDLNGHEICNYDNFKDSGDSQIHDCGIWAGMIGVIGSSAALYPEEGKGELV